jgi:hypothetical protein
MQFGNEYEMTRKRYDMWSVPICYYTPVFWIYVVIFAVSTFALIYFKQHGVAMKWETLAAFMMFIAVYRGIAFKWMATDKQYRLTKMQVFKDKAWKCKIEVNDGGVKVMANGKTMTHLKWTQVNEFQEGKTFYDLTCTTSLGEDKARLDKNSFTKGDAESFKKYMLEQHADIPYRKVDKKWDRNMHF